MGWSHCGEDDLGRPRGYGIQATCDHPECNEEIDRGLSHCCGEMHGGEAIEGHTGEFITTCGHYFCIDHLQMATGFIHGTFVVRWVCEACSKEIEKHVGDYSEWPKSYSPPTVGL